MVIAHSVPSTVTSYTVTAQLVGGGQLDGSASAQVSGCNPVTPEEITVVATLDCSGIATVNQTSGEWNSAFILVSLYGDGNFIDDRDDVYNNDQYYEFQFAELTGEYSQYSLVVSNKAGFVSEHQVFDLDCGAEEPEFSVSIVSLTCSGLVTGSYSGAEGDSLHLFLFDGEQLNNDGAERE